MLDFEEASDGLYQSQAALQLQLQVIWEWGRQGWSRGKESDGSIGSGELNGGQGKGALRAGTQDGGKRCFSWIIVRGVAWRKGVARRRGMVLRKALTALTKIEDEAPFHVGAARQILGCLDRVDGLGAHFALFGA